MSNFSQTQFGNIMQIVSAAIVLFGGQPLDPEQISALWIVVGMIGSVVGFIWSWWGRQRKGDLKLSGFRKSKVLEN